MTIGISTYLIYLAVSVALTIWVARTLHKNGRVFLVDVFHGNDALADSVNHLLVVGFYLINFGYVSLALNLGYTVHDAQESIEALSTKIGAVLLVLGVVMIASMMAMPPAGPAIAVMTVRAIASFCCAMTPTGIMYR